MTVGELISHLQRSYKPDEPIAFSLWVSEDVQSLAEDSGDASRRLTDKEVGAILAEFHHRQDADIGLNWQTLTQAVYWTLRESVEADAKGGKA